LQRYLPRLQSDAATAGRGALPPERLLRASGNALQRDSWSQRTSSRIDLWRSEVPLPPPLGTAARRGKPLSVEKVLLLQQLSAYPQRSLMIVIGIATRRLPQGSKAIHLPVGHPGSTRSDSILAVPDSQSMANLLIFLMATVAMKIVATSATRSTLGSTNCSRSEDQAHTSVVALRLPMMHSVRCHAQAAFTAIRVYILGISVDALGW